MDISLDESKKLESVKYAHVPENFRRDVVEFMAENLRNNRSKTLDDLDPLTFLKYALHWQGIVGYTEDIVELMESLGWQRPKPAVTIHTSKF